MSKRMYVSSLRYFYMKSAQEYDKLSAMNWCIIYMLPFKPHKMLKQYFDDLRFKKKIKKIVRVWLQATGWERGCRERKKRRWNKPKNSMNTHSPITQVSQKLPQAQLESAKSVTKQLKIIPWKFFKRRCSSNVRCRAQSMPKPWEYVTAFSRRSFSFSLVE